MSNRYAIHLFPTFTNHGLIDTVRQRFDPLYGLIPPHITLVFPFESKVSSRELVEHMKRVAVGIRPFHLQLHGFAVTPDNYLYIQVVDGHDEVTQLHDSLYTGILQSNLRRDIPYVPHLTVGRFHSLKEVKQALQAVSVVTEPFQSTIHDIVLERIADDNSCVIVGHARFGV